MPYANHRTYLPPAPKHYGNHRVISLLYWRVRRGLTLAQLAHAAGLASGTVERLERGDALAKKATVRKLAHALNIDAMVLTLPEPMHMPPQSAPHSATRKAASAPDAAKLASTYRAAIARLAQIERAPRQAVPAPEAFTDGHDGKLINFTAAASRLAARRGTHKQPW